jgi:hypothetical protein
MGVNSVTSDMARWVAEDVSEDGIIGFESFGTVLGRGRAAYGARSRGRTVLLRIFGSAL